MRICSLEIYVIICSLLSFFISSLGKTSPNFILVVSDSHSINAVGAYNGTLSRTNPTPNLDRIASKSAIFTNAFCSNSSSGPSGATLLTGTHSHINGFLENKNNFNFSHDSLPQALQKAGYETALIGRWDLGSKPLYFDHWKILADPAEKFNPQFLMENGKKRIEGHVTDIITDLVIQWLSKRKKNKPYFLMVQYNATSRPWMPAIRHLNLYDDKILPEPENLETNYSGKATPARYQEMGILEDLDFKEDLFFKSQLIDENKTNVQSDNHGKKNLEAMTSEQFSAWTLSWGPRNEALLREIQAGNSELSLKFQRFAKNYLRCIRGIDENLKRIEEKITDLNSSKIFFIYTSNQGRMLGEHSWFGSKWIYEESIRIPLIISSNFSQSSNQIIQNLTQNIDIAPTILEYANLENLKRTQGKSLYNLLENDDSNQSWRDSIYYHHHKFPGEHMIAKHYGVRTKLYKLVHFYQFGEWEFYDLVEDPKENENLYNIQRFNSKITEMKKLLNLKRSEYEDKTNISIMPEGWRKIYRGPAARKK